MKKTTRPGIRHFRKRGSEILRIEALSDAVFAFSVSLLVVALEVPQTFSELKLILQGALPFFATVSVLFMFWYQQYIFFRHYALNDLKTILLNLADLALILFYVYPLKFLFSLLLHAWTGINMFPKATEHGEEILKLDNLLAEIHQVASYIFDDTNNVISYKAVYEKGNKLSSFILET